MEVIWKYQFDVMDEISIEMPEGGRVVYVGTQHEKPCMWVRVNPESPKVKRYFHLVGTGHAMIKNSWQYLGSFMLMEGDLIFHLHE